MSARIMGRVFFCSELSSVEKLVALVLADCADDVTGECFPSVPTIMFRASASERSVQNALKRLEELKYIRRAFRQNRSSVFRFVLSNMPSVDRARTPKERSIAEDLGLFEENDVGISTPAGDAPVENDPRTSCAPPPQDSTSTPAGDAPITINEPSIEPSDSLERKRLIEKTFQDAWAKLADAHPKIPSIRWFDETRETQLHRRIKEWAKGKTLEDGMAVMAELFRNIHESHFLTGRNPRTPDFSVKIDWVLNKANFKKIMEGNYDRQGNRPVRSTGSSDRDVHASGLEARDIIRRRREQRDGKGPSSTG